MFQDSHLRFVGNEFCIQGDRLRHAIVYIPTAVQEKFMRNTGQGGRLKTICPAFFFLIFKHVGVCLTRKKFFMVFKVIAHRKIWRYFSVIIRLKPEAYQKRKISRLQYVSN